MATRRTRPGCTSKWPWQSSRSIDRRLRVFDPPPRELITGDKRNLEVASYVAWRVVDPEKFLRSAGDARRGRGAAQRAGLGGAEPRLRLARAGVDRVERSQGLVARRADRRPREGRRAPGEGRAGRRGGRHPAAAVQPPARGPPGGVRPDPERAAAGRGDAPGRGRGAVPDRSPARPTASATRSSRRPTPTPSGSGARPRPRRCAPATRRTPATRSSMSSSGRSRPIARSSTTARPLILSSASPLLRLLTQGPSDDLLRDTPPILPAPEGSPGEKVASPAERKP